MKEAVMAVYPLQPACPQCRNPLPWPAWWREIDHVLTDRHQVPCDVCKVLVIAQFYRREDR